MLEILSSKYQLINLVAKQNFVRYVASTYQLGITSPSRVLRKVIYRVLCNENISLDAKVSKGLKTKFKKWSNNISSCKAQIPKSIPLKR